MGYLTQHHPIGFLKWDYYITNPNNALFIRGFPSKLPYICIVWSPQNIGNFNQWPLLNTKALHDDTRHFEVERVPCARWHSLDRSDLFLKFSSERPFSDFLVNFSTRRMFLFVFGKVLFDVFVGESVDSTKRFWLGKSVWFFFVG